MAWTKTTQANSAYYKKVEALTLTNAGATVVTGNSSTFTGVSNQKFPVYLEVTETSAGNGGVDAALQVSHDGTTWLTVAALDFTLDTTATNKATLLADASDTYSGLWRISIFTDATDLVDPCTISVEFAARDEIIQ